MSRTEAELKDRIAALEVRITEKNELYKKIGTGLVDPLESIDTALRVGWVKKHVAERIQLYGERKKIIESEILEIKAREYIKKRDEWKHKLAFLKLLAEDGHIDQSVIKHHKEAFANFTMIPYQIVGLKLTIDQLDKQDRGQETVEIVSNPVEDFINQLPEQRYHKGKTQLNWKRNWGNADKNHGQESLYSIFPQEIDKDMSSVMRVFLALKRGRLKNGGQGLSIETKSQLTNISDEDLQERRGISKKSLQIVQIMRAAIADKVDQL